MKSLVHIPLLLASAVCASAINTAPVSSHFFKREDANSTITSGRPGPIITATSTVKDPSFKSLGWYNDTENPAWTVDTGCSCAQLGPEDCHDRCGYFGIDRTDPETGGPYSYFQPNGFTLEKMVYDWPDRVDSSFIHRGGAGRSYKATPTDDNPYFDYPPFQLNSTTAAELYPGDWPEKIYMWWFKYSDGTNPERAVSCLCAAEKDCGCAPQGWIEVDGFDAQGTAKNISSGFINIPEVVVNGTVAADELKEEEKLNAKKEETERVAKEWDEKVKKEKTGGTDADADADSGARGLVSGWGFLGLVAGVVFVFQY